MCKIKTIRWVTRWQSHVTNSAWNKSSFWGQTKPHALIKKAELLDILFDEQNDFIFNSDILMCLGDVQGDRWDDKNCG